VCDNGDEY